MDLKPIFPHLTERRAAMAINAVVDLEAAVASGMVPNKMFVEAKDTFSRIADEAAEAFLKTGPHIKGRNGVTHHQSDWWLDAYDHDAFVSGTHTLPTVLKRAQKAGLTEYAALLAALLPLRELLEAAKPLVKKRGELPKVKSAKQVADEADQMTCQCCGRGIFAATGLIAHHGYERPGDGYQTASCAGARELPFEVDRTVLGHVIHRMVERKRDMVAARARIADESRPIERSWETGKRHERQTHRFQFTRANFDSIDGSEARKACSMHGSFDELLASELDYRDRRIASLNTAIEQQRARYAGWKQTHIRGDGKWVEV